jgi:fructose-bisphosphate aldolase class II
MINGFGGNMPGAVRCAGGSASSGRAQRGLQINIDSDLRLAMTASVRKYLAEHPGPL